MQQTHFNLAVLIKHIICGNVHRTIAGFKGEQFFLHNTNLNLVVLTKYSFVWCCIKENSSLTQPTNLWNWNISLRSTINLTGYWKIKVWQSESSENIKHINLDEWPSPLSVSLHWPWPFKFTYNTTSPLSNFKSYIQS